MLQKQIKLIIKTNPKHIKYIGAHHPSMAKISYDTFSNKKLSALFHLPVGSHNLILKVKKPLWHISGLKAL